MKTYYAPVKGCLFSLLLGGLLGFTHLNADAQTDSKSVSIVEIIATDKDASEPTIFPAAFDTKQLTQFPGLLDIAILTLRRSGPLNHPLVVGYTVSGTAENGTDYSELPGTITIAANQSTARILIIPIDDALDEDTESVIVTLDPRLCDGDPRRENCYEIGRSEEAVAFIRDNDTENLPPDIKIVRPTDGQIFKGPTDIEIFVAAVDRDGTVVAVTFLEGDNVIGMLPPFISTNPNGIFPDPLSTHPLPLPSPAKLFPKGVFHLTWPNVEPGTYHLSAIATDNHGAMTRSEPIMITVVGAEDPGRPPILTICARDPVGSETTSTDSHPDTASFLVERTGNTESDLIVHYALDGTAENGVDYERLPGTLTIPAGDRSAMIVITPLIDDIEEKPETVVVGLTLPRDNRTDPPPYLIKDGKAAAIILDRKRSHPPCRRLKDGLFYLCRIAPHGLVFRIEASSDFRHWEVVCRNVVLDNDAIHFVDPHAPLFKYRFYRIIPD